MDRGMFLAGSFTSPATAAIRSNPWSAMNVNPIAWNSPAAPPLKNGSRLSRTTLEGVRPKANTPPPITARKTTTLAMLIHAPPPPPRRSSPMEYTIVAARPKSVGVQEAFTQAGVLPRKAGAASRRTSTANVPNPSA